jgi:hypothetical protein
MGEAIGGNKWPGEGCSQRGLALAAALSVKKKMVTGGCCS